MRRFIDLHIHTINSDGMFSPIEVLEEARKKKLTAFSITDHDSVDAFFELENIISENDPEYIPGLELSATYEEKDLHLLAYYIDPRSKQLQMKLEEIRNCRNERGAMIGEKLNNMDVNVDLKDIKEIAGKAAIGRPHIADAIYQSGAVKSYDQAFHKYIGSGKPAYVAKKNFCPEEAISMIHDAGGVAVLAHPAIDETYMHLEMLVKLGLDGIECFHSYHKQKHTDQFKHFAERWRLIITGGSDFHGRDGNYGKIGSQHVPEEYLQAIKERAGK